MKAYWLLSLFTLCAAAGLAQARPLVEVLPTAAGADGRPHLPPQRVGVGNCYGAPAAQQQEEIAFIKVTIPGPWARSAEHLAKEKAGELGANCLLPVGAAGEDNMRSPVQRSYKAYRVTVPMGAYQVPAPPDSFPAAPPSAGPAGFFQSPGFRKLTLPEEHSAHLGWTGGAALEEHWVDIDTAAAGPEVLSGILKDAEEFFPPAEYARLQLGVGNRAVVRIDLVNFRVSELEQERQGVSTGLQKRAGR